MEANEKVTLWIRLVQFYPPFTNRDSLDWNVDRLHSPQLAGLNEELPGCCWPWNNISDKKPGVRANVRLQITYCINDLYTVVINLNSLLFNGIKFIKFTLHFATRVPPTPLPVTFRRNLRSLSPSYLSSVVSSSLPSPTYVASLDVNAATDTLRSTLTFCLDDICHLSSRQARTAPSNPWLSDVLLMFIRRTWVCINRCFHLSPLKSTLPKFHNKINSAPDMRNLFRIFNYLLCPPSPPL